MLQQMMQARASKYNGETCKFATKVVIKQNDIFAEEREEQIKQQVVILNVGKKQKEKQSGEATCQQKTHESNLYPS